MRLITRTRYSFGRIADSLKTLHLTPPITKKDVKMKYLEMAKLLHPDVNEENPEGQKKQAQNEAFIEITKAYKHLSDLSEAELNHP